MSRFFVSRNAISNNTAVITGADVKHISRVLRLGTGDTILLADGEGREYSAKIRDITAREVVCELLSARENSTEAPVKVTLYQGLPKGEKMELVIQKGTELGVWRIVPVVTERTVVRLEDKKAVLRQARWQKVAEEAAKQAGRTIIPEVSLPLDFRAALEQVGPGVPAVMPWEEEEGRGIRPVLKNWPGCSEMALFIGPEGGFSKGEADLARERGVVPVSLGPRILRTETAGIVAVAVILYELGDLGGVGNG